ncbi:polysaccharide deacetylase family protein [bacterium]|nr:polysaccharide deacetylase family protein [bacterium]
MTGTAVARLSKRQILRQILNRSGGLRLLEAVPAWSGLVALNYHRIGAPTHSLLNHALWSASETDFDAHVRTLKSNFDLIGLNDLNAAIGDASRDATRRRHRFAMITFDDGYIDNYELAFPILQAHNAPATFFITTDFVGRRRLSWWDEIAWMVRSSPRRMLRLSTPWFDGSVDVPTEPSSVLIHRLLQTFYLLPAQQTENYLDWIAAATGSGRAPAVLSETLWMNWDQVNELADAGMGIGAHSVTHSVMTSLSAEEQLFEILESRLIIEHAIGRSVSTFSYPLGRRSTFNVETRNALSRAGFDWAFSQYGGFVSGQPADRFDIPRVAVETDLDLSDVRAICALPQAFARH